MKKSKLLIFGLLSTNIFALEGSFKTGAEVETVFSKRDANKDLSLSSQALRLEKVFYSLNIAELNLKSKELGFDFILALKSKRDDARISDFDPLKKIKSHDLMAKIYGKYETKPFYGLKSITDFTYYVDDFTAIRKKDSDNNIVEIGKNSEYVELVDGKEVKNASGNTIFNTKLEGETTKHKVKVLAELNYKANQLYNFTKDESYLKTNLDVSKKIGDLTIGGKHKLYYDLDFSSKRFDTFDNNLSEYPDFFVTRFVDRIKQDSSLNFGIDKKGIKVGVDLGLDVDSFLVRKDSKNSKIVATYNDVKPSLSLSLEKKIGKVKFKPEIKNGFNVRRIDYLLSGTQDPDVWLSYHPEFKFGFSYSNKKEEKDKEKDVKDISYINFEDTELEVMKGKKKKKPAKKTVNKTVKKEEKKVSKEATKDVKKEEKKEDTIDVAANVSYNPGLTLKPFITEAKYIEHVGKGDFKVEGTHYFGKDSSIKGKFKTDLEVPVQNKIIKPITFNADLEVELNHKISDKLDFNSKLNNEFKIRSDKGILDPDTAKNTLGVSSKLTYQILKNKKEDLKYMITLSNDLISSFNYHIGIEKKKPNSERDVVLYKQKIAYFTKGSKFVPISVENKLKLENEVSYKKEINEKLTLNTSVNLLAQLELLSLRDIKLYHYKQLESDLPEDKEKPKTSDYRHLNCNLGGAVRLTPNVSLGYKLMKGLELTVGLETRLKFAKQVINKVKDDEIRPDVDYYGPIDKKFEFKEFVPKVNMGLEYKW